MQLTECSHKLVIELVPVVTNTKLFTRVEAQEHLKRCNLLVLMGSNNDIPPSEYGQLKSPHTNLSNNFIRYDNEKLLLQEALRLGIPVFGICRGMQLINVHLGGSLIQHIGSVTEHWQMNNKHQSVHGLTMEGIIYHDGINSVHHQCVGELGKGLTTVGHSMEDGVPEVIIGNNTFGVQWHPEFILNALSTKFILDKLKSMSLAYNSMK